jgi:DNA-binding CsgD family transcriptional regulator
MNRHEIEAEGLSAELRLERLPGAKHQASINVEARRSLDSERWTLVGVYERDGKSFLVARYNDVRVPRPASLSPRERQALAVGLLSESNKAIAYKLGISASTVGVLLHRAAQKLGCRTRVELMGSFRASLAHPSSALPTSST